MKISVELTKITEVSEGIESKIMYLYEKGYDQGGSLTKLFSLLDNHKDSLKDEFWEIFGGDVYIKPTLAVKLKLFDFVHARLIESDDENMKILLDGLSKISSTFMVGSILWEDEDHIVIELIEADYDERCFSLLGVLSEKNVTY